MRDRSEDVDRLADLLVGFGANVQPGQILGVTAYLGMEDAARAVARAGYKRGAKYVDVFWWDQLVKRPRLELADERRSTTSRRGSSSGWNGSRTSKPRG